MLTLYLHELKQERNIENHEFDTTAFKETTGKKKKKGEL